MSAQLPTVVYLPPVSDQTFLKNTADVLERLRTESELRGHAMLASLLAITKGEVDDGLSTRANVTAFTEKHEQDDGAAMMAQRLACRTEKSA
jgi:hypothetical protein